MIITDKGRANETKDKDNKGQTTRMVREVSGAEPSYCLFGTHYLALRRDINGGALCRCTVCAGIIHY